MISEAEFQALGLWRHAHRYYVQQHNHAGVLFDMTVSTYNGYRLWMKSPLMLHSVYLGNCDTRREAEQILMTLRLS